MIWLLAPCFKLQRFLHLYLPVYFFVFAFIRYITLSAITVQFEIQTAGKVHGDNERHRNKFHGDQSTRYWDRYELLFTNVRMTVVTGSIARSARLPVFNLLRGRFWGFPPRRGDTLHRWGWNLARCQISPHRCNNKGVRPPKLKFLLIFDRNVEYKRPAEA